MTLLDGMSGTAVPMSNGWTCSCGAWVPNGITHHCPTRVVMETSHVNWTLTPARLSDEDVDRIARRVVELLDQRAG